MEPLSTALLSIALATPAISTRRPEWESYGAANTFMPSIDGTFSRGLDSTNFHSSLNGKSIYVTCKPSTDLLISQVAANQYPMDRKDMLIKQILSYALLDKGWDGEGSLKPNQEAIEYAQAFIEMLPSGIPLPTPMLASDGEIGFYWDTESAYADLHLENQGTISLYSRQRYGALEENYTELVQADINPNWLLENLMLLNKRELLLAA